MSGINWDHYGECGRCGTITGQPCNSMAAHHRGTLVALTEAHTGRPRVSGANGAHKAPTAIKTGPLSAQTAAVTSAQTCPDGALGAGPAQAVTPKPAQTGPDVALEAVRATDRDLAAAQTDPNALTSGPDDPSTAHIWAADTSGNTLTPNEAGPKADWVRIACVVVTAFIGVTAAVVSYRHALEVAQSHGEAGFTAYLIPLTIDGLVFVASMVLLDYARRAQTAPPLAYIGLWLGILATVAVNVLHGIAAGPIGAAVAAWPALTLTISTHLLQSLFRKHEAKVLDEADTNDSDES